MNATEGNTRCSSSLSKFEDYQKERHSKRTPEQRQKINLADVDRRQRRRGAELCTYCREPVASDRKRCDKCNQRFTEFSRTRRANRTKEQRYKENAAEIERRRLLAAEEQCIY